MESFATAIAKAAVNVNLGVDFVSPLLPTKPTEYVKTSPVWELSFT